MPNPHVHPGKCSACGKSFRGWEPLTDGKGKYYHKKCAPQIDPEELRRHNEKMFSDLSVDQSE